MALSYSAYTIATLAYHFPCVRGESVMLRCDIRPWSTDLAHTWYLYIIHCFLHIPYIVTLNEIDMLIVCFTCVHHLLDCLFYMLCCMRPTKLVHIPARCNSKVGSM